MMQPGYMQVNKGNFYEGVKRFLDIFLSTFLFILFFPIVVVVCILILLDSRGPIFADTPPRVGKNGRLFKMYKFRSMIQNAHEMLRENPKFAKLFSEYKKGSYKLKDDPRITRVGRFIRRHSL